MFKTAKTKTLIATLAAGTLLCVPALANAATTGTITGATINPAGTQVGVGNLNLVFDSCGGLDPIAGFTGCAGVAGVVPASQACPSGSSAVRNLWDPGSTLYGSSGIKTFNSGPASTSVSSPVAHRVCLYSYVDSVNFGTTPPVLRDDEITPAPNPPDRKPPKTTITKGAPNQTDKSEVQFKFRSSEGGSTFKCKEDKGPWKRCSSPTKMKRLHKGQHTFQVRATDRAGNSDRTPAVDKFKVIA